MAVKDQVITDDYALYHGDCLEVMPTLPDGSVQLSVYSPPFGGLYNYSSSDRDLSNSRDYDEFMKHYRFVVDELFRMTMPGRMTAVHCMDIPSGNSGCDHMVDFPGDIIRLHADAGFKYTARYCVWKEPLGVRNRTMAKNLAHKTIVDDSSKCSNASADYLLVFRKAGTNPVPIAHPTGLKEYAGEREMPKDVVPYRDWSGNQIENRYSHWIWRQYASAFWDDVRSGRVLPFKSARGEDDERHVHPLQLDVIERCVILWSNPGEVVFTPFMGVGSEVYGAVIHDRKGVGIELKDSYYRQAVNNMKEAVSETRTEQQSLFDVASSDLSDNLDETFDPPSSVGSVEADEGAEYLREERAGMGQF
jgi:DNA modification methylase